MLFTHRVRFRSRQSSHPSLFCDIQTSQSHYTLEVVRISQDTQVHIRTLDLDDETHEKTVLDSERRQQVVHFILKHSEIPFKWFRKARNAKGSGEPRPSPTMGQSNALD